MRHLLFDTETTGLSKNSGIPLGKQPRIFELFALVLDDQRDWLEVEHWHSLFDPAKELDPDAAKVTGIMRSKLIGQPSFSDRAHDLQEFFLCSDVIVGHNLNFDLSRLQDEFKRIEREFKTPKRLVCTAAATEHLLGHRMSLTDLHLHLFGEKFAMAHMAEPDVRAMARCYVELHKRGVL